LSPSPADPRRWLGPALLPGLLHRLRRPQDSCRRRSFVVPTRAPPSTLPLGFAAKGHAGGGEEGPTPNPPACSLLHPGRGRLQLPSPHQPRSTVLPPPPGIAPGHLHSHPPWGCAVGVAGSVGHTVLTVFVAMVNHGAIKPSLPIPTGASKKTPLPFYALIVSHLGVELLATFAAICNLLCRLPPRFTAIMFEKFVPLFLRSTVTPRNPTKNNITNDNPSPGARGGDCYWSKGLVVVAVT